jgi:hypothetical protein
MKPNFAPYLFAHQENLIVACIGGSQAHGAKRWAPLTIPIGTAFMFLRPKSFWASNATSISFSPLEAKSEATDHSMWMCVFTLLQSEPDSPRKGFLFVQLQFTTNTWDYFTARPEIFLAKGHVEPFLGFANDQMKRLLGQKGQKNVHRAELETTFGYDTNTRCT